MQFKEINRETARKICQLNKTDCTKCGLRREKEGKLLICAYRLMSLWEEEDPEYMLCNEETIIHEEELKEQLDKI